MLVPYNDPLAPHKEALIAAITDDERTKLDEIDAERRLNIDKPYQYPVRNQPSLVLDDFLFLGNVYHASNRELLERLDIKHVLNVCDMDSNPIIRSNFNVIEIPMLDDPQTNIKQHFDRTNELLHGFYEKNERCLVHCAAGVSRSATIVLAYLMKYHHNTLRESYLFLIDKRPQIWPNEGFLVQLIRYEKELIRSREIKPNDNHESINKEENPIETLNEFENKHKNDK